MQELHDPKRLALIYGAVQEHFCARPPLLRLVWFEKGELLNHPLKPLTQFLIVVEGQISIYNISDSGSLRYVSRLGRGTFLGDVEFCGVQDYLFYTQAEERVLCLAIPFAENLHTLENDPVFLRFAMRQLAQKLSQSTMMNVTTQTLEEKVLLYLEKVRPDHTLPSVNGALTVLHCSRRQLQRVLKKLCEDGTLHKSSRGRYELQK